MAAPVDWLGLDDTSERVVGHNVHGGDDFAETTPQPFKASPAVLTIAVDSLDGTPAVETGDEFRIRGDDSFVPIGPGPVHSSPALVQIPPAAQDFGLSDQVAFISGVYPDGTQPLYAFSAWNDDNPATYTGGYTNAHKWGAPTANTPGGTITYSFGSGWTEAAKTYLAAGLALWSDVANISFAPAAGSAQGQIVFNHRSSGGSASTNPSLSDPGGGGLTGGSVLLTITKATISIDTETSGTGFGPIQDFTTYGGYPIETLLHEEGHAIGLGHAGPYNGTVNAATQQFSAYDTRLWSLMSYIEPEKTTAAYYNQYPVQGTVWHGNDPTGLMLLDILAAQALYGAPTATPLSGGQVFGFNSNVAGPSNIFFDFTQNVNPVMTLWDAGTNNTLDLSGWSESSTINLNPGTFSSAHGMINNLSIAFGTAIDRYVGGSGDDTVTGNNDGDTFILSRGGSDAITGGAGNDGFFFGGAFNAADHVDGGGGGNNQLGLEGDYSSGLTLDGSTITNVQAIAMLPGFDYRATTGDSLVGAGQSMTFWSVSMGVTNSVSIDGSAEMDGSFKFFLGRGSDTAIGGAGNDLFYGEGGQDTLRGNGGADTFAYLQVSDSTSTGYDIVQDFTAGTDKFDFPVTVTGIDAAVTSGSLVRVTFDSDLAGVIAAGQLAANHAVLFTDTGGSAAYIGHTFLIVDANGTPGYQSGADYVIDVTGISGSLSTSDFV